jgi:ribosomal protein S18 acetylase RimI-like enzyme
MIRPAVPGDELAVARIHVRAWQHGYRGLIPDAYLDSMRAEDRAARYTFGIAGAPITSVALAGDSIVGFVTIKDDELAALHVDPDLWRRGVGTRLLAHALTQLASSGVSLAWLHVLTGNTRARSFYERDGWSLSGAPKRDVVWGVEIEEIRYERALAVP